jgi:hypothetical protein
MREFKTRRHFSTFYESTKLLNKGKFWKLIGEQKEVKKPWFKA